MADFWVMAKSNDINTMVISSRSVKSLSTLRQARTTYGMAERTEHWCWLQLLVT